MGRSPFPGSIVDFSKSKVRLGCGLALLLIALPTLARPKPAASPATDPDYRSALAAANRFLHAWQVQDHETGLVMLSDAAKRGTSVERLQSFFSPGPEAAFEIHRGKKLKAGRYAFPTMLFTSISERKRMQPRLSLLIVTRTSKDDWAVDKLP